MVVRDNGELLMIQINTIYYSNQRFYSIYTGM